MKLSSCNRATSLEKERAFSAQQTRHRLNGATVSAVGAVGATRLRQTVLRHPLQRRYSGGPCVIMRLCSWCQQHLCQGGITPIGYITSGFLDGKIKSTTYTFVVDWRCEAHTFSMCYLLGRLTKCASRIMLAFLESHIIMNVSTFLTAARDRSVSVGCWHVTSGVAR